jgi:Fe/S biogenesis protein NfuA
MIQIHDGAQQYFRRLIEQQDAGELALKLSVAAAGTPRAECQLSFCESDTAAEGDQRIPCDGFDLIVDAASVAWLEEAELDFEEDRMGGQLLVRAPNIKGGTPADDAPLEERVQHLIDSEINPSIAAHGGVVSLVEVDAAGVAILQFGGGCHGCGMVGVTLKEGIEKTLVSALPEITGVRDVTDHSSGENPYYA